MRVTSPGPALAVLLALAASLLVSLPAWAGSQLILFETAGCGYCKAWLRDVGPGYGGSEYGGMLPLRRVDLAKAMPTDLRGVARPAGVPTFVVWTCNREMARFSGYSSKKNFYSVLGGLVETIKRSGKRSGC